MNDKVELQKIKDDIKYIKKTITGNGETGLLKTVESLRETIRNIQDTLIKLQSYSHFKNWILGCAVSILTAICGSLATYVFFVR